MKKTIYKNRKCPIHTHCWGYKDETCNDCDIGNEFLKLYRKIERLKKKLERAEQIQADTVRKIQDMAHNDFCSMCDYGGGDIKDWIDQKAIEIVEGLNDQHRDKTSND